MTEHVPTTAGPDLDDLFEEEGEPTAEDAEWVPVAVPWELGIEDFDEGRREPEPNTLLALLDRLDESYNKGIREQRRREEVRRLRDVPIELREFHAQSELARSFQNLTGLPREICMRIAAPDPRGRG